MVRPLGGAAPLTVSSVITTEATLEVRYFGLRPVVEPFFGSVNVKLVGTSPLVFNGGFAGAAGFDPVDAPPPHAASAKRVQSRSERSCTLAVLSNVR